MESNGLVPKFRFPEFRGTPGWEEKSLGDICEILNNRRIPITSSNRRSGSYPYYGASGIVDYIDEYIFDERLVLVGEDGAKWEAFEPTAFIVDGKYWVNNHAHVLRPTKIIDTLLASYVTMINVGAFVTGAAPPKLTLGKLKTIGIPVPPRKAEQEKIAECLTSLDELIAAEGRKLEALRTVKKGLMQYLFPRPERTENGVKMPAETTSRLRFPEFRHAGKWQEKPLGELVDLLSGYPFDGKDIVEDDTGTPLMRGINITEGIIRHSVEMDRYYVGSTEGLEKYRLKQNDLVIGMDGSKVGKNSALIDEDNAGSLLVQRVARLRTLTEPLIRFIFQQVHAPRFHVYVDRINTSSGIPHISATQIKEYPIHSTDAGEQKLIADCLCSLDAFITSEAKKLEILRTHRKGLMRGLFPSLEQES